jgi:hypothetical protein
VVTEKVTGSSEDCPVDAVIVAAPGLELVVNPAAAIPPRAVRTVLVVVPPANVPPGPLATTKVTAMFSLGSPAWVAVTMSGTGSGCPATTL